MKIKTEAPLSLPRVILPSFLEFVAFGTGVGKSLLAAFAYWIYLQAGYQPTLVRIESRAVRRDGADIVIDTEAFARAAQLPGGVAGVLQPLFSVLKSAQAERNAVIVDWGGGQSEHRNAAYAATRFGSTLAAMGIPAVTAIVTTAALDHMKQATENLATSALVAPEIRRVLVQNRHDGDFNFEPGSSVRATFDKMMEAAKGASIMKVADVDGESWKRCEDAHLTMAEVVALDIDELAQRINLDEFLATACQSQVAAWMTSTEQSMLRVLAGRDAADS
jgi:hypothetical protein